MSGRPWSYNIVELLAVAQQVIGRPSWVLSDKLGDLGVPVSKITTLLNSCGKLLLVRLAIKGKSLKKSRLSIKKVLLRVMTK